MAKKSSTQRSSGNVFSDLKIPQSEECLAKTELTAQIFKIVKKRRLTQIQAGQLLGINQPKVSALLKGQLDGFSSERLFRFLNMLGCDIRITVSNPHPKTPGRVRVMAG